MKYLELEKRKFLEEEIMMSVFSAAFSRGYPVYRRDKIVPETFKKNIAKKMREQVIAYQKEKHIETLIELQKFISSEGEDILYEHKDCPQYLNEHGGWITFGRVQKLLNLYLKYRWSLGWDNELPLHCPIDRSVLTWAKWDGPSWTSPNFGEEEYKKAITRCENEAVGQNLSEWELIEFNKIREKGVLIKNIRKCLCTTPLCAKCLSVNCEDDNCKIHTKTAKEDWRRRHIEDKSVNNSGMNKSEKDMQVNYGTQT